MEGGSPSSWLLQHPQSLQEGDGAFLSRDGSRLPCLSQGRRWHLGLLDTSLSFGKGCKEGLRALFEGGASVPVPDTAQELSYPASETLLARLEEAVPHTMFLQEKGLAHVILTIKLYFPLATPWLELLISGNLALFIETMSMCQPSPG